MVGRNGKPEKPTGRPSKLAPDTEARILNAIRCGAPNKVACAAAGIGERTLYEWEERARVRPGSDYEVFAERLARARQEGITARLALIQKAASKDWRAAAWLLERDLPEAYSLRFKIEHSVEPFAMTDFYRRVAQNIDQPKLEEGRS